MTYRRMQEIHVLLDDQPMLAKEMVLQDQRNNQAHNELSSFNRSGKFANVHPFIVCKKQYADSYAELVQLRKNDSTSFLKEITNVTQNIRRIQSRINKKRYKSEEEKISWEQGLQKALIRKKALEDIIST